MTRHHHFGIINEYFKLYQIYPATSSYSTPASYQRNDQIFYNRLRIGLTRLTHSYLIEHENVQTLLNFSLLNAY